MLNQDRLPLQHILNLVFAIGELMLNCMPHFTYLMGFMGLYTAAYGVVAFTFFLRTGRWIYPVSSFSKRTVIYSQHLIANAPAGATSMR